MSAEYPSPDMADVKLVDVLGALADPTRLEIVRALADGTPHPKNAKDWDFDMQKSGLAYHFKALREAGITNTIVNGRTHDIQLRRDEFDARFPGLLDALIRSSSPDPQ
ncbi:MAG: helix-turn-helix transcriptional regulator [Leifsonia sp.]